MAVGGQDDDRRSRVRRDLAGGRQAIETGHLDVEKDGVGKRPPAHLDRPMTIADHRDHIVAQRFQLILQSNRDWFFVIRDQNTIRPSHRRNPSGHNQGDEDLITQIECRFIANLARHVRKSRDRDCPARSAQDRYNQSPIAELAKS